MSLQYVRIVCIIFNVFVKWSNWSRWSQEVIAELQQRKKWKQSSGSIVTGTLVLIKEKNLPPLVWQLGRVMELHPGPDEVARVVTLRTSKGIIKRAVSNICPLPCSH